MAAERRAPSGGRGGRGAFVAALLAALLGLALSVDLLHTHRLATTGGAETWCDGLAEGVGCSPVARSEWARVLGVPTAAWALLVYAGFAALATMGIRRSPFPAGPGGLLFWAAIPGVLFGLFLAYVMVAQIGAICVSCLGLDLVNVVLLVAGLVAVRGRGGPVPALREDLAVLGRNRPVATALVGGPVLAALLVVLLYPRGGPAPGPTDGGPAELPETWIDEPIDTEGVPCRGPDDAPVVVHEFSDYECPYCRRAHAEVREIVERFGGRVRLCHFHYPLDMACNPRILRPFHRNACLAAAAAVCSEHQDRFWQMNDLLYENARSLDEPTVLRLARRLRLDEERFSDCLRSESTTARLEDQIARAVAVPVEGTPTFVVNGRIIPGALSSEAFEALLSHLLEAGGRWEGR